MKTKEDFYLLKTPDEFMNYLDKNVQYGWLDFENKIHLNTIKEGREKYRISTIDEIFNYKIGTCIEQTKLAKYFFDLIGLENKIFCKRRRETEENFGRAIFIHCIILFKRNNIWYQFEHASGKKNGNGIYKFDSLEDAIDRLSFGIHMNKQKAFTEIPSIPDYLSLKDFHLFVNSYDDKQKKLVR